MFQFKNYIFFSLFITLFSCNNYEKSNQTLSKEIENEIILNSNQKVTILITSDDKEIFNNFSISNSSYLFGKPHKDIKKSITSDTLKVVLDSISKPMIMEASGWGKDSRFYHTALIVVPSDSILLEIKNNTISFKGTNAVLNKFLYKVYNSKNLDYGRNPYLGNLNEYKERVKLIRNKREEIFESSIKDYNVKSEENIKIVKEHLNYGYMYNLICPRTVKANVIEGLYFNALDGLKALVEKEYSHKEEFFDYGSYLENVDINYFTSANLKYDFRLVNSLNTFIRNHPALSEYADYSKEKLLAEKEFIEKNLDGEMETFMIARMIRDYYNKGFGNDADNIEFLNNLIDENIDKFSALNGKDKFERIKEELVDFNFEISNSAINSKLLNKVGDTLTINKVFKLTSNKIKVLIFWTSWCYPCIDEIQKTKSIRDKLAVEKDVEWIYLSIDEDKEKWLNRSEELKEYLNVHHQYFVLNGIKSLLSKNLKVWGIPKYVILDKKNRIILNNGPKPSDSIIFNKIIDDIISKN